MLKQLSLILLSLISLSCGQNKNAKSEVIATDSPNPERVSDTRVENESPNTKSETQKGTNATPTKLLAFVPEGYSVLDTASGDLNLDPYSDMILVLKKDGEDTTSDVINHPEKRPLLIFIGQADNSYKLVAKSVNAVYCVDCGGAMGDPFMGITIKKGYFSVEHYGGSAWRWSRIITFKYSPADSYWDLHKDGGVSFHASEPEKQETKIYSTKDFGKVPFDKFDVYKED